MKTLLLFSISFFLISSLAHAQNIPLKDVQLSTGSVEGMPISINGEEVWPFVDGQPYPYPDAVIWSVNSPKVSQVVRDCMKASSDLIASWVTNPHDPIHKALLVADKYNVTTSYFLWTNDYTKGQSYQTTHYRSASSWNWKNSYLKFESTVDFKNAEGVEACHQPMKEQAFNMIVRESKKKAIEQQRLNEFEQEQVVWEDHPQDAGEDKLNLS